MSFLCQLCRKPQKKTKEHPDGHRPVRLVLATREVEYLPRPKVFERRDPVTKQKYFRDDPGGFGVEIVKEALACRPCAKKWAAAKPAPLEAPSPRAIPIRPAGFGTRLATVLKGTRVG